MRENNNTDLNEVFEEEMDDADVITVPIDETLSKSGEAADAKTVGDALALKADKSELQAAVKVNNQPADAQGLILIDGRHIPVNDQDAETLAVAVKDLKGKTAENILMSSNSGAKTIAEVVNANAEAIESMEEMTGAKMPIESGSQTTVKAAIEARVKTVNRKVPDADGDVDLSVVPLAENLQSDKMESVGGSFIIRMTGGNASVSDGKAYPLHLFGSADHTGYVAEQLNMTVIPITRTEPDEPITATIDRDTFVAYVEESGTINLYYTTEWSADPELYGITVTGTPVAGDQITVEYVKEVRGTITVANPARLVGTGWNLFDYNNGYAHVVKYSTEYGYKIGGSYTSIQFSATLTGERTSITPSANGMFNVNSDGYVFVTGGNNTDTYILATWSDWRNGPSTGYWESYRESGIDLSAVMTTYFPNGLLAVGTIRDEIDLSAKRSISRIERLAYSEENRAAAAATGRSYDFDQNYIYIARESAVLSAITIDTTYNVSEHGLELFTETALPVITEILYGKNLRDKLERDVLTISQQDLAAEEQAQVRRNIGVMDPPLNGNGTAAQLLKTNGDGTTEWTTQGTPTDAQVGTAVSAWLEEHPEATTTVQDGAISRAKLNDDLKAKTDAVSDLKSALGAKIFKQNAISRSLDFDYTVNSGDYVQFEVLKWTGETPSSFLLYARVDGSNVRLTTVGGVNSPIIFKSNANYEHFRAYVNVDTPQTSVELVISISNLTRDNNRLTVLQSKVNPQTSWLSGKKIGIVGDSVSTYYQVNGTYTGYMNTAHYPAYSVKTVDETWWMRVINSSGAELDVNASVGGGGVTNQIEGKPSLYARSDAFTSPDVVIVAHGYNDAGISVGTIDYNTDYTQLSESTFGNAYLKGVKAIMNNYPSAKIILLCLTNSNIRKGAIKDIANHLNLDFIDVSSYTHYSSDNVHPDIIGMREIASMIISYNPEDRKQFVKYEEITGKQFKVKGANSKITYVKKATVDNTGYLYVLGENICPTFTSGTSANIVFTVDDDGKVTANGTNDTADNTSYYVDIRFPIYGRFYTLSGVSGGSDSTYSLVLGRYLNGVWNAEYKDYGNGYSIKADERYTYRLRIIVKPGTTMNNVVFTPTIVEGTDIKDYVKYSLQEVPISANCYDPEIELPDGVSYLFTGEDTTLTIGVSCEKDGCFDLEQLEFDNSAFERLFETNKFNADSQTLLTDYASGWEWGVVNAYIDGKETGRGITTSTSSTSGVSRWIASVTTKSCLWFKIYVINLENIKDIGLLFRTTSGTNNKSIYVSVINQITHNGLNYVRFNLADGEITGTVSSYTFAEMRLLLESHTTDSATQVNFGSLYTYDFAPMCTLFFDDGDRSQYENAYPVMKTVNMQGDIALITGKAGDGYHLTIPEIHEMTNDGWDICSHTKDHLNLRNISKDEIDYQMRWSRDFLIANGAGVSSNYMVVPFDVHSENVDASLLKYSTAMRNNDGILNTMPIMNRYAISSFEVQQTVTLATVKAKIDEAIAKKQWLILLFHIIDENDQQYHWLLSNFEQVINYLDDNKDQIKIVSMANGLLLANGEC